MADLTGLGLGFVGRWGDGLCSGTMRGHNLARIITKGAAMPNTGVPYHWRIWKERVLHAPAAGEIHCISKIADIVEKIRSLPDRGTCQASLTGVCGA